MSREVDGRDARDGLLLERFPLRMRDDARHTAGASAAAFRQRFTPYYWACRAQ